jgi:hypothetical protein
LAEHQRGVAVSLLQAHLPGGRVFCRQEPAAALDGLGAGLERNQAEAKGGRRKRGALKHRVDPHTIHLDRICRNRWDQPSSAMPRW